MSYRVWVGIPIYRVAYSWAVPGIVRPIVNAAIDGLLAGYSIIPDKPIAMARNEIVEEFLADERATHLWFIDDDTNVTEDALRKLLAWEKPFVSGLYFDPEHRPVAHESLITMARVSDPNFDYENKHPLTQLRKVAGVGLGCALIERSVFHELQDLGDVWFETPYKNGGFTGEDVFFCEILGRRNISIYVDPSIRCGHLKMTMV